MERIHCFKPLINSQTKILIVGTMPSVESLDQQMYYANSRNHFWDIIYRCLDSDWIPFKVVENETKSERYEFLLSYGVGLWDIIQNCYRDGSNDSKILDPVYNDFYSLLAQYTSIQTLIFNGQKAESFFKKSKEINSSIQANTRILNSTSSLNPNNTFRILNEWREVFSKIE